MNITERENPFAFDPPTKKKRRSPSIRPNNDLKSILIEFKNSDKTCVSVDHSGYIHSSSCSYSVNGAIKCCGFEEELEVHEVGKEVLLFKSNSIDRNKLTTNMKRRGCDNSSKLASNNEALPVQRKRGRPRKNAI